MWLWAWAGEGQPGAGTHLQAQIADQERVAQVFEDAPAVVRHRHRAATARQQDGELVAPRRARASGRCRRAAFGRRATAASRRSPTPWPWASLTAFEGVQIEHQQADGWAGPAGWKQASRAWLKAWRLASPVRLSRWRAVRVPVGGSGRR